MFPTRKLNCIKKYGDNSPIIVALLQFGTSLKLLNLKSRKTDGCSKFCKKKKKKKISHIKLHGLIRFLF